jgi:16S rRNA (adenine1518-N6/adenine1519-N6)-dimethyltransferase
MNINQQTCQVELSENGIIPRKYYGQVFTTDPLVIKKFIQAVKSVYKEGTKIVEIGGGLGYITSELANSFKDVEVVEYDEQMYEILNKKFIQTSGIRLIKSDKSKTRNPKIENRKISDFGSRISSLKVIKGDILEYIPPKKDYLLAGNIPFHISGRLYRKFMSETDHKPYAMVFITDKQYASTLMGQPPRCYRVSLQAQAYGNIEIVADVPPTSVYPEPKVMSCIMKITQNPVKLPKNFWDVVNYNFENFPTKEVNSPKTMSLKDWIKLCEAKS